MVNSQNGWPASKDKRSIRVGHFEVAGVEFPGGVKQGDVAVVLASVARNIHERVERLHEGWCWGYAYREVTGGGSMSNHASGTAVDINAPDHGYGAVGTFTAKQSATIRAILREHDDVVRWGGDYAGTKDEMHFEINAGQERVARLADKIRNADQGDDMTPKELLDAKFGGHDAKTALASYANKPGTLGHFLLNQSMDLDAIRAAVEDIRKAVQK